MRILILALLPTLLGGCVVGTLANAAVDVVTLPVKIVSAGVDAATTSQSEADQNRGAKLRKADEQRARDERQRCKPYSDHRQPCPPAYAQ